jgi:regulator of protease activity HflC (stomatin/prohibitin superfamily)
MLRARQRVLTTKNVPLLWSFVRLIAWDPIEGVLILRNKTVAFCDDNLEDAAGGVRLLYSIFGEELAIRAPLEVQTLSFRDENVLTREYLSVTIRGTMKWRIVDLKKFYLLVSRERRSTTNHNDHESISASTRAVVSADEGAEPAIRQLLRAAIGWMQVLVEEETRTVVSRAKTGLLIADKLSQDLSPRLYDRPPASTDGPATSDSAAPAWGGAAEGLAGAIHATIAMRLEPYGIAVEDVSLQEIKLPEEVMQECIAAAKSYYFPTIAKRKAAFGYEKLKAQADVIGADAVGTREVVGAAPAFTLPDFLSQYLQKRMPAAHGQDTQTVDGALITGAIATIAANSSAQLPRRSDGEKT